MLRPAKGASPVTTSTLLLSLLPLALSQLAGCGGEPPADAVTTEYWDEAKLVRKAEGVRKYGREEGLWIQWHENGVKAGEVRYEHGLRQGPATWWAKDGSLALKGVFKGDEEEGLFEEFWPNGTVRKRTTFTAGAIVGRVESYYADGTLETVTPFEGGAPHGIEKSYHPSGSIFWSKPFERGLLEGPSIARHPDGGLLLAGQFRAGHKIGTWNYWHPDGSWQGSEVYDPQGAPQGTWIKYAPEGQAVLSQEHRSGGAIFSEEWGSEGRRKSYGSVTRNEQGLFAPEGIFFVWRRDGSLDAEQSGVYSQHKRTAPLPEDELARAEILAGEPAVPEPRPAEFPRRESFDPGS